VLGPALGRVDEELRDGLPFNLRELGDFVNEDGQQQMARIPRKWGVAVVRGKVNEAVTQGVGEWLLRDENVVGVEVAMSAADDDHQVFCPEIL
jgi:hypothetical protein